MIKSASEQERTSIAEKPLICNKRSTTSSLYNPKLSLYLLSTCVILFIIFHIKTLQIPSPSNSPFYPPSLSFHFPTNWQQIQATGTNSSPSCDDSEKIKSMAKKLHESVTETESMAKKLHETLTETESMAKKLRESVTFLPLKDLRFSQHALEGHTWFMSSMYDKRDEEGEVQYQKFPPRNSEGRILCIKGNDTHDGSWNYYALAWPGFLPQNAILMKGLTFVSYNHYNYDNIWHGLSATAPFVTWHLKNQCAVPARWILYHWAELRTRMGPWLTTLMEATFGGPLYIEGFDRVGRDDPVCFEEAVVMRHNEGGMNRERRMEMYDQMRCRARVHCKVQEEEQGQDGKMAIGLTMFMRTGPRSFKNESAVVRIFEEECRKVEGCRLMVAYSNNLTFCEQVRT